MKDNRKKALLVVSFGTSDPGGRKNSIESVENALREAFPDRQFYRAWTSGMIISILSKRGVHVDSLEDAILRMKEEGIDDVLVQPTHVLPGIEYEKILKAFGVHEATDENSILPSGFRKVHIGRPLISNDEDIKELTSVLRKTFPLPTEKELLICVGHGTRHKADEIYKQMEDSFHKEGFDNVIFVTLEGSSSLSIMERIKSFDPTKICLVPFLFVCGEHARNDIGGKDADSLLSLLKRAGYDTQVVMKGLGEYPLVQSIYVEHARELL